MRQAIQAEIQLILSPFLAKDARVHFRTDARFNQFSISSSFLHKNFHRIICSNRLLSDGLMVEMKSRFCSDSYFSCEFLVKKLFFSKNTVNPIEKPRIQSPFNLNNPSVIEPSYYFIELQWIRLWHLWMFMSTVSTHNISDYASHHDCL